MGERGAEVVEETYRVTIHYEEDHLWAEVHDLPGCFASGRDPDELREALAEAIGLYLTEVGAEATTVTSLELDPIKAAAVIPARVQLVAA